MTEYQVWQLWLQGLVATGTLLIAILAIWGESIRKRIAGPKLRLRLLNPKGECSFDYDAGVGSRYYHLQVWNERPSATAHNVRILMRKVARIFDDGTTPQTYEPPSPVQMEWHSEAVIPEHVTMGPEGHTANLGLVTDSSFMFNLGSIDTDESILQEVSRDQRTLIQFQAVSDEVKSKPMWIEIDWDGEWADKDEDMAKHLKVRECPEREVRSLTMVCGTHD